MLDDRLYEAPRRDLLPFFPVGARRMLDVGCGAGGFGRTVLDAHPGVSVCGVEPYPPAAQRARDIGYEFVVTGEFPATAGELAAYRFDVVFFNDVLEHTLDPTELLDAARELLSDDGCVVASIPNIRHFSVLWDLVRHDQWRYEDRGLLDRTHLRFFTSRTMRALFEDHGWTVRSMTGHNRARWPNSGMDTWKTRALSRATAGRSDPFFWTQYVVEAAPADRSTSAIPKAR